MNILLKCKVNVSSFSLVETRNGFSLVRAVVTLIRTIHRTIIICGRWSDLFCGGNYQTNRVLDKMEILWDDATDFEALTDSCCLHCDK